jgi:hypothetical protein
MLMIFPVFGGLLSPIYGSYTCGWAGVHLKCENLHLTYLLTVDKIHLVEHGEVTNHLAEGLGV